MANVKWAVDPTHSEVQFKVKHLMITTVTGYFEIKCGVMGKAAENERLML
jgi:polyisoprenoid-binding protein YceI